MEHDILIRVAKTPLKLVRCGAVQEVQTSAPKRVRLAQNENEEAEENHKNKGRKKKEIPKEEKSWREIGEFNESIWGKKQVLPSDAGMLILGESRGGSGWSW